MTNRFILNTYNAIQGFRKYIENKNKNSDPYILGQGYPLQKFLMFININGPPVAI